MKMNQPMSERRAAGCSLLPTIAGRNSTAVAPMVLTIWIAPKTRERSWYLTAITEAHDACDSVISEVPM